MASGSKVAVANCSTYIQGAIDWSTSVSGSNIVVTVKFYMRRTNTYSGATSSSSVTKYINISGDANLWNYSETSSLTVNGGQENVWQGPYFTATRTFDSSRGGDTIYVGWKTVDNTGTGYLSGNKSVSITLPTVNVKPTKPTNSITGVGITTLTVTYGTTSFNTPSTGTVYLYGGTATAPTTQIASKTTTGNSAYTYSGLVNNTKYYFRSRANNGQWSDYSTEINSVTKPAALSAKSATVASTTSIKVSYTTAAGGTAYAKNIQYSLDNSTWTTGATVSAGTATSGNFTISNLTPGTAYTIYLRVSTTAGATASGSVSATTYKVPNTPTISGTNASATSNTITYGTTSFNTPASGTVYLYGGTTSTPSTQLASKTTTGNSNYSHTGLAANTTYYYRARANNTGGNSAFSSTISVITRPKAPTISLNSYNTTSIKINYSVPADGGAATKTLKYSIDNGSTYTNVTTISGSAAASGNFTITGLTPGTNYTIRVMSSNSSGGNYATLTQKTASVPTGGSVSFVSATWNTVTLTASITNYGYPDNLTTRKLAIGVGNAPGSHQYKRENQVYEVLSATVTVDNNSVHPNDSALTLCGCASVYPYLWAYNGVVSATTYNQTEYFLPPAPLTTLAVTSLTPSIQDVTASFRIVGAAADGTKNKIGALVNTEYRYKTGSGSFGSWITAAANQAPDTAQNITLTGLPFDTLMTVEARQVYSGQYSETKTLTFTTSPQQYAVYGSVNGATKPITKLYGSINNQTKQITKLYGSVNGLAKRIF